MAEFDKYRLGSELETYLNIPLTAPETDYLVADVWKRFHDTVGFNFVDDAESGSEKSIDVVLNESIGFVALASITATCKNQEVVIRTGIRDKTTFEIPSCTCVVRCDMPASGILAGAENGAFQLRAWQASQFSINAHAPNPIEYESFPYLVTEKGQLVVRPKSKAEEELLDDVGTVKRTELTYGDRILLNGFVGIIEEKYKEAVGR